MIKKEITYYKAFTSKKCKIKRQKSSQKNMRIYPICDEDKRIKTEIKDKFICSYNLFYSSEDNKEISYSFNLRTSETAIHNRIMEYDREVYITKRGFKKFM